MVAAGVDQEAGVAPEGTRFLLEAGAGVRETHADLVTLADLAARGPTGAVASPVVVAAGQPLRLGGTATRTHRAGSGRSRCR